MILEKVITVYVLFASAQSCETVKEATLNIQWMT